jgi:hypothetical protein
MSTSIPNERYEAIVDAALTFFTILVGLKLADLIDDKSGKLGGDKWPCFVIGVAVFLRYVTGSFVHQRAQHVNQPDEHDGPFLIDIGFLIAFGIIAVWACVADQVPEFLHRLIVFTATAFAWTIWYLAAAAVAKMRGRAYTFKYSPWFWVNLAQIGVLWGAKALWPPPLLQPTARILCLEFRWLWILSLASVALLFWDLWLQLKTHESHAASHGAP